MGGSRANPNTLMKKKCYSTGKGKTDNLFKYELNT